MKSVCSAINVVDLMKTQRTVIQNDKGRSNKADRVAEMHNKP